MDQNSQNEGRCGVANSSKDVREKVKMIMARVLRIPATDITGTKLIRDDLGMDSMQAIESLAILEKDLGIVIDPDKAFNVATIDDLFTLVEGSLPQPSQVGVA